MRAVVVDRWMEPSELTVREAPEPALRAGSLMIDVRAAGCNFFDILMARGQYQVRPPFPFIPGAEVAGIVRAVADDVRGFAPGDAVLSAPGIGAFAERALVAANATWRLPAGMSFEEGAAFPIVYPTSYAALVYRAALQPGETLLVHAAAGGVGLAAVQIGKALGARVIATAGGEDKLEIARRAGADVTIDYRQADWVDAVKQATDGRGADVIYDSVGGDTTDGSLKCIAWNGRLLVIGFASGRIPEVKLNRVLLKNIAITGLHWGAHAVHEPARVGETFAALFRLYEAGSIRPVVYARYPLAELPAALDALGSRKSYGKIVVTP
ncbi:MAG TPA: NADPH:quinone oxidoreductase family protein [Candidatus Limnocylindria bacterium]|nr:NADPH:quinone oxidoreductase family protein [Candidatus Limnocylindria bacterium]